MRKRIYAKLLRKRMYAKALFFLCVFVFLFALFGVSSARAGEATLKIDPPQGTFYVGSSFDVSIILDTGGETINAVETELRFPQNTLQVTSPTAARSFVAIWTSPPSYSNQDGFVRFQGGIPSPGLKTSQGVLSTVSFRATQPGTVTLELRDSRVLLADGSGTNIFSRAFGARYTIAIPPPQGPRVFSPTHPEFSKWYQDSTVTFAWDKDAGVSDFSWSFDEVPNGAPDTVPEGSETAVTYKDAGDGLWYFHIRARKENVWGGVTSFPVKIDTTPPAMFTIEFDPKSRVTANTKTRAIFRTTDALAGIDHYEVKIVNVSKSGETRGTTFFLEAESPYIFPELTVGNYEVVVRAYDLAGNFQDSSEVLEVITVAFPLFTTGGFNFGLFIVPWKGIIGFFVLLTLVIASFTFRFWRRHRIIRARTDTGLEDLRGRLKTNLDLIRKHVEHCEDTSLHERFRKELETIEKGAAAKEKASRPPLSVKALGILSLSVPWSEAIMRPEVILGSVVAVFILFDIILFGFLVVLWRRSFRLNKRLKKEAGEIHEALRIGFLVLKKELERDLGLLEERMTGTGASKDTLVQEREIREKLLADMSRIEKSIQQEVSDIDKFLQ